MKIYRDPYTKLNTPSVIALGCFDGVHAAHAAVIAEAVRISRERGCTAGVWCFSEPPKNAFLTTPVPLICTESEKERQIRMLGADLLISPDFSPEIAAVSAGDFVRELLCARACAVHLVCGRNYTFGAGGRADTGLLSSLCSQLGIGLSVIDDVSVDGVRVSSTIVREAVESGQCLYAARMLGRDFCVEAELRSDGYFVDGKYLAPADGVYRVSVSSGLSKKECNASVRRTDGGCVILPDTSVYGERARICFLSSRKNNRTYSDR